MDYSLSEVHKIIGKEKGNVVNVSSINSCNRKKSSSNVNQSSNEQKLQEQEKKHSHG